MIDQLTDQEKTDLLFQVMGWVVRTGAVDSLWEIAGSSGSLIYEFEYWGPKAQPIDLYELDTCDNPLYMFLSWRCHLWALDNLPDNQPANTKYRIWFRVGDYGKPAPWTRKNAQRLWLDKILELTIEAGLVKLEEERG